MTIKKLKQRFSFYITKMSRGDFSFADNYEREMLADAYQAISVTESWDVMKADPGPGGFMFSANEYMKPINAALKYDGHSGASYAWTMRQMQFIAKNGWDDYVSRYINSRNP